jgi:hypothetical protein
MTSCGRAGVRRPALPAAANAEALVNRALVSTHGLKKVVPGPDPEGSWQGTAPEGVDDYLQAVGVGNRTPYHPNLSAFAGGFKPIRFR